MSIRLKNGRVSVQNGSGYNSKTVNTMIDHYSNISICSVVSSITNQPTPTLLTATFQKISYFTSERTNEGPVFAGGVNIVDQEIHVNVSCHITIECEMSIEFGNGKDLSMTLAVNGVNVCEGKQMTGLGVDNVVPKISISDLHVNAGDVITIVAKSLNGDDTMYIRDSYVRYNFHSLLGN